MSETTTAVAISPIAPMASQFIQPLWVAAGLRIEVTVNKRVIAVGRKLPRAAHQTVSAVEHRSAPNKLARVLASLGTPAYGS